MIAIKYLNAKVVLLAATILPGPVIFTTPVPATAQVDVIVSSRVAPPMLPIYVQPPIPEVGYIWTPGYWNLARSGGYHWVPGTWVQPPAIDVLWTPPYWDRNGSDYVFHAGYWGSHVGYYGGVNYGYGYSGSGYDGGRWEDNHFVYNRSANNFGSVRVPTTYRHSVIVDSTLHVSYAGAPGTLQRELRARPGITSSSGGPRGGDGVVPIGVELVI